MAPVLPTELLEVIVELFEYDEDRIQNLLSLCSTARGFVNYCQKHLFRDVILYHPVSSPRPEVPQAYVDKYKKALLFAKAVTKRPDLAAHVKTLEYWMPSDIVGESQKKSFPIVMQALDNMVQIFTLTLGFDGNLPVPSYFAMRSTAWQKAIASLLQRPTLTRLALHNILPFPLKVLLKAVQLQELDTINTCIECSPGLGSTLQLRSLRSEGPVPIFSLQDRRYLPHLGIPNLVELNVNTKGPGHVEEEGIHFLRQCRTLRTLQVTYSENVSNPTMASPLDELNPESFTTLTHLTMNITTNIARRDALIDHPYRSLPSCDALRQLSRLETLVLNIYFRGCLIVHPSAFGPFSEWDEATRLADEWSAILWRIRSTSIPQWTGIYDIVSNRDEFPVLKKFEVNIHAQAHSLTHDVDETRGMNGIFVSGFKGLAEPVMRQYMAAIQARGIPIEFVLTIEKPSEPLTHGAL